MELLLESLSENGGTLKDNVGDDANLTLNSVGSTSGVLVDAVAPTVNSISVSGTRQHILQVKSFRIILAKMLSSVDAPDFTVDGSGDTEA